MNQFKYFCIFLWLAVAVTARKTGYKQGLCVCNEGYTYSRYSDKCYKFHTDRAVWADANKGCREEGAQLVIMNNLGDQKAIKNLFSQQGGYPRLPPNVKESAFVGITKSGTGEFYTIHGQSLTDIGFSRWREGEPNNVNGNENCLTVGYSGAYSDDPCDQEMEYICEHDKICEAT